MTTYATHRGTIGTLLRRNRTVQRAEEEEEEEDDAAWPNARNDAMRYATDVTHTNSGTPGATLETAAVAAAGTTRDRFGDRDVDIDRARVPTPSSPPSRDDGRGRDRASAERPAVARADSRRRPRTTPRAAARAGDASAMAADATRGGVVKS
jgi:hypothetical protein